MIALLDTNVVLRFLTSDKSPKYEKLYSFFQSLEQGDMHVELKLIVFFQVVFMLKSYYKIPKDEIASGLLLLLEYKGISIKEKKVVRRTLELFRDQNPDLVDCYLIACVEGDKQNRLYSYDIDFDKFAIQRVEP